MASTFHNSTDVDAEVEVAVGLVGLLNFDLFERGHYAIRAQALFDRLVLELNRFHPVVVRCFKILLGAVNWLFVVSSC